MPNVPVKLTVVNPAVDPEGLPSQVFRAWIKQVENSLPIVGTGTPEGVLEAPQYSLYIDEAVPLTPVQYRKMLPNIGGDKSQGWAVI